MDAQPVDIQDDPAPDSNHRTYERMGKFFTVGVSSGYGVQNLHAEQRNPNSDQSEVTEREAD